MALPGRRERPVTLAILVTLERKETKATPGIPETPVIQVRKERKATKATPGIPVIQVPQEKLAILVTLEMTAKPELKVRKATKATPETPAKKAQVLQ